MAVVVAEVLPLLAPDVVRIRNVMVGLIVRRKNWAHPG